MKDWLFDAGEVSEQLTDFARVAVDALNRARTALERSDPDVPTRDDLVALAAAAEAVTQARVRLQSIEGALSDADRLLFELLVEEQPRVRVVGRR